MEIIVGKTAGFCFGVKRTVENSEKLLKQSKETIFCLGEIVHNKEVIDNLKSKGIKFIDNIYQSYGKTIIRAHGVPKQVYEIADKRGIDIEDYTCPNVLKIHEIVSKYSNKGYYIFLCGSKEHPENIGTLSYCGENVFVIENENDTIKAIEKFQKSEINKCLLISQTTFSLEKFYIIREIIENELSENIEVVVKNTICNATQERQEEVKNIAKKVDYMIIIGGKNSSNTKKLFEIAKSNCENSIWIENKKELKVEDLKKYNKIGIMAGASTPSNSIDEVVKCLQDI